MLSRARNRSVYGFDEVLDTEEGWAKENRHYWLRDWRGYAEFFFGGAARAAAHIAELI